MHQVGYRKRDHSHSKQGGQLLQVGNDVIGFVGKSGAGPMDHQHGRRSGGLGGQDVIVEVPDAGGARRLYAQPFARANNSVGLRFEWSA